MYEGVKDIRALWLVFSFASVKKSWPHNASIRLYVRKNEKGWDLAKIKLEYSDKTHVLSWNFFQRLPKMFPWPLRSFSRYVYAFLKYIFPSVTKSWPHGSAIRLYLSKSEKSWYFEKWNSKSGWNILTKPHVLSKVFFELKASGKISVCLTNMFKVSERSV